MKVKIGDKVKLVKEISRPEQVHSIGRYIGKIFFVKAVDQETKQVAVDTKEMGRVMLNKGEFERQVEKPTNKPCPYCDRNEEGKWFSPCPSDDCPSYD